MEGEPGKTNINGGSISVKKLEPINVRPETQIQNNGMIFPLSTFDQPLNFPLKLVYIFSPDGGALGSDHRNYYDVLKKGLARVLVHYYPFSGRLVMRNEKLAVEINSELGVPLVKAFADGKTINEIGHVSELDPQVQEKFVYTVPGVESLGETPLLTLQVTEFKCGGFALGLVINHCMVDGTSTMEFVKSWAETSRGISQLSVPPFLDRTILTNPLSPNKLSLPCEKFGMELDDVSNLKTLLEREEIVCRSFHFNVNKLASLKKIAMEENEELKNCSSITVLAALLWRNRSRALNMKPNQETRLVILADIRSRFKNINDNSFVIPKGYFGSGIVSIDCVCMAGELMEKPFSYVVKMVQNTIKSVNEDYIKSYMDFFAGIRGGKQPPSTATVVVASWTRIPFEIADFGWGEPTQFGAVLIQTGLAVFQSDHQKGIVLVQKLPASAMNVFQELIMDA